jgi:hypothetical protein
MIASTRAAIGATIKRAMMATAKRIQMITLVELVSLLPMFFSFIFKADSINLRLAFFKAFLLFFAAYAETKTANNKEAVATSIPDGNSEVCFVTG